MRKCKSEHYLFANNKSPRKKDCTVWSFCDCCVGEMIRVIEPSEIHILYVHSTIKLFSLQIYLGSSWDQRIVHGMLYLEQLRFKGQQWC